MWTSDKSIVNRPHHNCHDSARLLFKFLLYDTCQIRVSWAWLERGGERRATSAKGTNKTVVSYSWANSQKQKAILMTDTRIDTHKQTQIYPHIYRPKYRPLLVNLHGNMQMSLLARCQSQRQTPMRRHWRLSCFLFCFLFFFFWEYISATENRIIFT